MASQKRKIKNHKHLNLKNGHILGSKKLSPESLFLYFVIFSPYLELLFWDQRKVLHLLILILMFLYLVIRSFPLNSKSVSRIVITVAFGLYFLMLATINLVTSEPVHRSTWSIALIAAFFLSSLKSIQLNDTFFWIYLRHLKLALKITLVLHVLIFVLSKDTYSRLSALEVNPIPIFALSAAISFFTRDRLLVFLTIIAVIANLGFNPQNSHIFILVVFLISFLSFRLKPRISFSIVCTAILCYFFANRSLFESFLLLASSFETENIVIRQNMSLIAQQVISQNPFVGGHLSEPLNLLIKRGSFTSVLPFHSDVLTFLVAGGGIGLFLFLANCLLAFYRTPSSHPQDVLIKSSNIALACSLLVGLFNPLFPGFALFMCLTLSFQPGADLSFTRKEAPTSDVPHITGNLSGPSGTNNFF